MIFITHIIASLDENDQKVHESLVASKPPPMEALVESEDITKPKSLPIRKNSRHNFADRNNSLESFKTMEVNYSTIFEPDDHCPTSYSPRSDSPEARPVERAIEARTGSEDGLGSMVRCLHFAETFMRDRKLQNISLIFREIVYYFDICFFSCHYITNTLGWHQFWTNFDISPNHSC